MSNRWGFDWKDAALVGGAVAVQLVNMLVLLQMGAISVALVMIVCTRFLARVHACTIAPAYRLGQADERRRSGKRPLVAVRDDVPRGSMR